MRIYLSEPELKEAVSAYIGQRVNPKGTPPPEIKSIKVRRKHSSEEASGVVIELKE